MRNENDNVKTFEVQTSIDQLSIEKGTKLKYQHSVSADKVFFLYESSNQINHNWFLPLSLVESRTAVFKQIPNRLENTEVSVNENSKTEIYTEGVIVGAQG